MQKGGALPFEPIILLLVIGLFEGVEPQVQVGAQVTVTVSPTLTETVFDVRTTVVNVSTNLE